MSTTSPANGETALNSSIDQRTVSGIVTRKGETDGFSFFSLGTAAITADSVWVVAKKNVGIDSVVGLIREGDHVEMQVIGRVIIKIAIVEAANHQ